MYASCTFRFPKALDQTFARRFCNVPQACVSRAFNVCNAPVTCMWRIRKTFQMPEYDNNCRHNVMNTNIKDLTLSVWQLNLNISRCKTYSKDDKTRVASGVCTAFLFIHAGDANNARHMSRTRFEHAQGSPLACLVHAWDTFLKSL